MTPAQVRVLEALSEYRFLTVAQMQRLGAAKDRKHLGDLLRRLEGHGLIGVLTFGTYPGLGRLPRMFYLKAKGADALAGILRIDPAGVPYVRGTPKFEIDHVHRRQCVDLHIALNDWAAKEGRQVRRFTPYYAGKGEALKAVLPGGKLLVPDVLCDVTGRDGKPVLTVIEVCRDTRGTDRGRIVQQMEGHRLAMAHGSFADALGEKRGNRVLAVFERTDTMKAVAGRLIEGGGFNAFAGLFLFNTYERVVSRFGDGWQDLNGNSVGEL